MTVIYLTATNRSPYHAPQCSTRNDRISREHQKIISNIRLTAKPRASLTLPATRVHASTLRLEIRDPILGAASAAAALYSRLLSRGRARSRAVINQRACRRAGGWKKKSKRRANAPRGGAQGERIIGAVIGARHGSSPPLCAAEYLSRARWRFSPRATPYTHSLAFPL